MSKVPAVSRRGAHESYIESRAVVLALRHGVISVKLAGTGNRGKPDRMFLIPGGRPLFIEFKSPGERPSELQLHVHAQWRALGYDVQVHDNLLSAETAILEGLYSVNLQDQVALAAERLATSGGSR